MWNLSFDYQEALPAKLFGYHLSFCILSWTFRRVGEKVGLVLGLDKGGSCVGRAFRVAGAQRDNVVRYLDDWKTPDLSKPKVLVNVYRRKFLPAHLPVTAGGRRKIKAACYVCEHTHE